MKTKTKRDLCNGPILSNMFFYALPIIATGVLQTLYNAADTMVVGQFAGDESLAAVSSTSHLINLLVNLFLGLSSGVLAVVARHIGAKNKEMLRRSVHTAIPVALVCGLLLLVLGLLVSAPLLKLMGTGEPGTSVFPKAVLYTKIYFLGMPGFLLYNFGASILRAAGDTKRPLIFLTASGLLNVALNVLFVVSFQMDVAGVALATIISQYISAILVLFCLMREKSDIRFCISHIVIDRSCLSEFFRIGLPAGVSASLFSVSNVLIQSTCNSFGDLYMAGKGAATQILNILYAVPAGYETTVLAYTSQNYGAQNKLRIRRGLYRAHLLTALSCATMSSLIMLLHQPLLRLFTDNPVAIDAGKTYMFIILPSILFGGAMNVQSSYIRGLGFSLVNTFISLFGTCALRVLWVYTVFPLLGSTWVALYLTYPVTWAATFLGYLLYTRYANRVLRNLSDIKEVT